MLAARHTSKMRRSACRIGAIGSVARSAVDADADHEICWVLDNVGGEVVCGMRNDASLSQLLQLSEAPWGAYNRSRAPVQTRLQSCYELPADISSLRKAKARLWHPPHIVAVPNSFTEEPTGPSFRSRRPIAAVQVSRLSSLGRSSPHTWFAPPKRMRKSPRALRHMFLSKDLREASRQALA